MKHLKSFFENNEEPVINGLYIDDIREMFFDIEDEGYSAKVKLVNVFVNRAKQNETGNRVFKFELVPQFHIEITRNDLENLSQRQVQFAVESLFNSDLLQETIRVARLRLSEFNLEINQIYRDYSQIRIIVSEINI